jgi:hypothetical protein
MNKSARARLSAAFMCLVWTLLTLQAQSEIPWFKAFTDRVLRQGHEVALPPHLALVLGLGGGEAPVAVKQLGIQTPQEVQTFNVCSVKGRTVVVLLRYERETQITHAFLLGSGAKLQKAVIYKTGAEPALLSNADARNPFQQELQYWSDRANSP